MNYSRALKGVAAAAAFCIPLQLAAQSTTATPDSAHSQSAMPAQNLSDAEIVHIVSTVNAGEVDAGKVAQTKATGGDVKKYADMMVKDHTDANSKLSALAGKAGISPKDNETSQALKTEGTRLHEQLAAMNGADFDRAYMQGMVSGHQKVLDDLDKTLIPSAQNADLKKFLTDVRKTVASHLEKAQKLSTSLASVK